MKKFIYMALSALTMICNMSHAAAAGGAGFLEGIPRIATLASWEMKAGDDGEKRRFGFLVNIGKMEEGIEQDAHGYKDFLRGKLGARASDRDVAVMRQLVHLANPAADVADPYAAILGQATDLLEGIAGIIPEETALWAHLYALCNFDKGWMIPQMPDDHSHIAPAHVVHAAGGNVVVPEAKVDYLVNGGVTVAVYGGLEGAVMPGLRVDFDGTMAALNAKINAYRAAKGLPAL